MKTEEILGIAQSRQVSVKGLSKANMIRKIQRHEGNNECYGKASAECPQSGCLWREDCLKASPC